MQESEKLRQKRLVFYKDAIDKIDKVLDEFLKRSNSKCTLLIDKEGHMVTKRGHTEHFDTETISALVAGSFAATREMARLLGEDEFTILFHQGRKDNIQLSLIGDRTLMAVIFDEKTTLGMARLYANEASRKLELILKEAQARQATEQPQIGEDFGKSAKGALDDFFKE